MHHLRPGELLEQLSADVLERALTGGSVGQLARLLLRVSDELRQIAGREVLLGDDEECRSVRAGRPICSTLKTGNCSSPG
jgi:hypothetical protein